MKKLFLIIFFVIGACAPSKKEIKVQPASVSPKKLTKEMHFDVKDVLSKAEIEKRIRSLKELLKDPELSEEKKRKINNIISNYESVLSFSSKGVIKKDELKKLILLLYQSFSSIEKEYVSVIQKRPVDISKLIQELVEKRKEIVQAYNEKRYTDVVNQCLELKLKYGGDILDPETEMIFALSLGEMGMIREAMDTGEKVIQQFKLIPEKEILRKKIEEWKNIIEEAELPKRAKEETKEEIPIDINLVILNAKRLIKQENFEQALAILNESGSKSKEIEELKNKAIEGIINRERNKAAKLFLLAKETKELQKKQEYLEESYRILEALILQYPNSDLIKRVKENLARVVEELKKIKQISGERHGL